MARYIKFGELISSTEASIGNGIDVVHVPSADAPDVEVERFPAGVGMGEQLTREEEDAILRDTADAFAGWVTEFLRRVILLFENLPEEGPNGTAGGATEGEQNPV